MGWWLQHGVEIEYIYKKWTQLLQREIGGEGVDCWKRQSSRNLANGSARGEKLNQIRVRFRLDSGVVTIILNCNKVSSLHLEYRARKTCKTIDLSKCATASISFSIKNVRHKNGLGKEHRGADESNSTRGLLDLSSHKRVNSNSLNVFNRQ